MQPKGQFSSGSIAHKASAPTKPQQLSLKSPTAHLRPCNPRDSLAQAEHAMQPTSQFSSSRVAQAAPAAQFDELNYSTHACSPRASLAQAVQPIRLQRPRASAAQLVELSSSIRPQRLKAIAAQLVELNSTIRPQRPGASSDQFEKRNS